jgi:hypothetical protein
MLVQTEVLVQFSLRQTLEIIKLMAILQSIFLS